MSKMEKVHIHFMNIDSLVRTYQNNENMNLDNIGVKAHSRFILSQVLYSERKITIFPSYILEANKKTYNQNRKRVIKYFIEEIIVKYYQLGKKEITINSKFSELMKFINWSDEHSLCFLENIEAATNVFWQYTYYLKDRIRLGTLNTNTAQRTQKQAYKMLHNIFDDKKNKILVGNRLIISTRSKKREKSSEEDQKYHFNFCYKLFHRLTDFLLEGKAYPLKLDLPGGEVWSLPSSRVFINSNKHSSRTFSYSDGAIKSEDEIYSFLKLEYYSEARSIRNKFLKQLDKHNSNLRSKKRISLGYYALKAYYLYFLTITQMNDSTAATLLWSDEYTIEKKKQKFRNIKYRAGNKPVEFQIQSKFINDFKKFLKLRDYVLAGKKFDYLFFNQQKNSIEPSFSNSQKIGDFSSSIHNLFIMYIDPNLPRLTSRQLRVNKTYQVIKTDGIVAASQLAQSSINTIATYYLGESQESTNEQFEKYFDQLNKNIFQKSSNDTELSVGQCRSFNSPEPNVSIKGIDIDCNKAEGCLFCKHYGLHADETDIKKLFSLKYVIKESRYIAKSEEHFLGVYGIVLNRIDNIISQIIKEQRQSQENINLFQKDVFENENLHPYWEHKLKTLINMGVIK